MRHFTLSSDFDNWETPGTWIPLWQVADEPPHNAVIVCPECHGPLVLDHVIDAQGRIQQAVLCLYPGCAFHEPIVLDGWAEYWQGHPVPA